LLKVLPTFEGFAQLLGAGIGDSLGAILAILPDLILVIGAQRMFGVGSRAVLGLERTVFHLVNPGHFLKDHLALLDEVAHGRNMSTC